MSSEPRRDSAAFEKLGEDVIHESWITFARGRFRAPDGTEFTRELVHHPGAVSVVPLLDDGDTVLLVRQYRGAVDRLLLEIPAGKRDVEGEPPEETARRELIEEVGMKAGKVDLLCNFFNSPGFSDERHFVYMARQLQSVDASAQSIEEDHMTVEKVSLSDLPQLIASGTVSDAKTMLGLLMTKEWLEQGR